MTKDDEDAEDAALMAEIQAEKRRANDQQNQLTLDGQATANSALKDDDVSADVVDDLLVDIDGNWGGEEHFIKIPSVGDEVSRGLKRRKTAGVLKITVSGM
jgi:hypothetical protein